MNTTLEPNIQKKIEKYNIGFGKLMIESLEPEPHSTFVSTCQSYGA